MASATCRMLKADACEEVQVLLIGYFQVDIAEVRTEEASCAYSWPSLAPPNWCTQSCTVCPARRSSAETNETFCFSPASSNQLLYFPQRLTVQAQICNPLLTICWSIYRCRRRRMASIFQRRELVPVTRRCLDETFSRFPQPGNQVSDRLVGIDLSKTRCES